MRYLGLLLVALAGCGLQVDPVDNNHGYGWQYDAQGPRGLKLRTPMPATEQQASFYENIASTVASCVGTNTETPPPFVIVVAAGSLAPRVGNYYSDPQLIVIDEGWEVIAYEHEVIHWILNGDPDHTSTLWQSGCVLSIPG
jgi:hypothetical protein